MLELEDTFMIWGIDTNMTPSKKKELEKAAATRIGVIGKEVLKFQ